MEMTTRAKEPQAAGAHKLAEKWTSRLFINGQSIPNGEMDLRSMNAKGHLDNGSHHHGTTMHALKGDAQAFTFPNGQPSYWVVIDATDGSATYEGALIRDAGGELVVAGFFKFHTATRPQGVTEAQNEGIWVITKP